MVKMLAEFFAKLERRRRLRKLAQRVLKQLRVINDKVSVAFEESWGGGSVVVNAVKRDSEVDLTLVFVVGGKKESREVKITNCHLSERALARYMKLVF